VKYWKLLMIGCVVLLVGCAGQQHKLLPDARSQYQRALDKYESGHYDDAILEFQKVLFSYPGLNFIDSAQYYFAMSYYQRGDYHLAINEFRRLITQFTGSALSDDAQYMIGKSYLESAPGNTGLDQSDTEQAIKELQAFVEDYPNSDRQADGEKLLHQAQDKMVKKLYDEAHQYYRLGAHKSARLYFEMIVTEHSDSKYVPKALYMLAKVDMDEKKYTDARDKLKNLLSAFPDSDKVKDAKNLKRDAEKKIAEQQEEQSVQADKQDQAE
jgi:outer membrane protein assembly factor BamD